MYRIFSCILIFLLVGCSSLNFRTTPLIMENCQYQNRTGIEFKLNKLEPNFTTYSHIYLSQSRDSLRLPINYVGLKGKLTGQTFERDYPKQTFWRSTNIFERASMYDDGYDDLYISAKQKEVRDRKAKFVVKEAVLETCQIVYISIDSLVKDRDNPLLIESDDLSIIK